MFLSRRLFAVLVLSMLTLAATARAETGPELLVRSYLSEHDMELTSDNFFFNNGAIEDSDTLDGGFHLRIHDVKAWWRILPFTKGGLSVGHDLAYFDIEQAGQDTRLVDQQVSIGTGLADLEEWKVAATVGVGYAGNNPYADGEAWYATGNLIFVHPINEVSSLTFVLNYDGNRSLWPDIPLPAAAYQIKLDPTLDLVLGLPLSSMEYRPSEPWLLKVDYSLPLSADVLVQYEAAPGLFLVGEFENRFNAFTIDGTKNNDRLFFRQRRVEAGVKYGPDDWVNLYVGGGYAFDQEFEEGWDVRDTDKVFEISDEPYVRVGVELMF